MKGLRAVGRELWGLFIDDLSHAAAVLVWIAVLAFLAQTLKYAKWLGPILFVGLAVILVENVGRAARRRRPGD
jgi:hypothetical protein